MTYFDCFKNHIIAKRIIETPTIIKSILSKKIPIFKKINPIKPINLFKLNIVFSSPIWNDFVFLNNYCNKITCLELSQSERKAKNNWITQKKTVGLNSIGD